MKLEDIYHEKYSLVYDYIKHHAWKTIDVLNIDEIVNKSFYELDKKVANNIKIIDYDRYLCNISYNVMRNAYSYKRRYYAKNIELTEYYYGLYVKEDLLNIIIANEQKDIVRKAINTLDIYEKIIIILHYFYNFSYKDISNITKIKYQDISKYNKKGLSHLKVYLESIHYEQF